MSTREEIRVSLLIKNMSIVLQDSDNRILQ